MIGLDANLRRGVPEADAGVSRGRPCGAYWIGAVVLIVAAPWCSPARVARAVEPAGPAAAEPGQGLPWVDLFDGRTLEGWQVVEGDEDDWSVVNGTLTCAGRDHGWLGTEKRYDNFRLVVEFRLPAGGDSGVFLRAADEGNPAFEGLEVQLLDDRAAEYRHQPAHGRCGGIYSVAGPAKLVSKSAGEWQTLEVICGVDRVKTILNGEPATEIDLESAADSHPGAARRTGRIGLQSWGTAVEFRRVRIQNLGRPG